MNAVDTISGALLTVFGAIVTLAIVSVFVGRKSQAPAAFQAAAGGLAQVIGAAVNPAAGGASSGAGVAGSGSNPALGIMASPSIFTPTALLPGLTGA